MLCLPKWSQPVETCTEVPVWTLNLLIAGHSWAFIPIWMFECGHRRAWEFFIFTDFGIAWKVLIASDLANNQQDSLKTSMTGAKYRPSIYQSQSHLQIQRVPGIRVNLDDQQDGRASWRSDDPDGSDWCRKGISAVVGKIESYSRDTTWDSVSSVKVGPNWGRDSLCVCCHG